MKFAGRLLGTLILLAGGGTSPVLAQGTPAGGTYKCVGESGRSTYTNVREEMTGKKCVVVSREVSVVPAQEPASAPARPAAKSASPAAKSGSTAPSPAGSAARGDGTAQRVDPSTQKTRDNDRRRILEEELRNAERELETAKKNLAAQEAVRSGDERNYQRVLDRLKPFQDEVRRSEDNVAALKREISNLR
jgi:hypothetical protein